MKKKFDLKSFVTVAMVLIFAGIIAADIFYKSLSENLLLLFTNLITAVFTYYFTKKDSTSENIKNEEDK